MTNEQPTSPQPTAPEAKPPPGKDDSPYKLADDPALLAAWQRHMDYDRISTQQKKRYLFVRELVIVLGLLTSSIAVFTTYLDDGNNFWMVLSLVVPLVFFALIVYHFLIGRKQWSLTIFRNLIVIALSLTVLFTWSDFASGFFRLTLIVMPVATVALMNYGAQFAASNTWIDYRISAEIIRRNIYLFVMRAGEYALEDHLERQQKLLEAIRQADERIPAEIAVPYRTYVETLNNAIKITDKFLPASADDYLKVRLNDQLAWYINQIEKDYDSLRREQVWALGIAGAGTILAAFGSELTPLVAVTTAVGIAWSLKSGIQLYGKTYMIYHVAANELQHQLRMWQIEPAETRYETARVAQLVVEAETAFEGELLNWAKRARETQSSTERRILRMLNQNEHPAESEDDNLPPRQPDAPGGIVHNAPTNGSNGTNGVDKRTTPQGSATPPANADGV